MSGLLFLGEQTAAQSTRRFRGVFSFSMGHGAWCLGRLKPGGRPDCLVCRGCSIYGRDSCGPDGDVFFFLKNGDDSRGFRAFLEGSQISLARLCLFISTCFISRSISCYNTPPREGSVFFLAHKLGLAELCLFSTYFSPLFLSFWIFWSENTHTLVWYI